MESKYYVYDRVLGEYIKVNGEYAEVGLDYVEEMESSVKFLLFVNKEDVEKDIRFRETYYGGVNLGE